MAIFAVFLVGELRYNGTWNIFKDGALDKSCMCNSLSVKSDKWEMTNEMLASSLFILIKMSQFAVI